ncbi:MAG: DUF4399 domain-containing protein [Xanthomonadales bacterium]
MNLRIRSLSIILFALAALVTAPMVTAAESGRSPSPDGATVGFANLADGDVVPPGFTVKFTVSGMGIAPAGVDIENTGHFHLLIDLDALPDMNGPLPATPNIVHFGKGQSETQLDLPEGPHTLRVMLAVYLHVPHDPPVVSEPIRITVSSAAPAVEDNAN